MRRAGMPHVNEIPGRRKRRRQQGRVIADAAAVRTEIAARFAGVDALTGISSLMFGQPLEGRHWLQSSNPSERWKWDFMYQDLPPVKGAVELTALPPAPVAMIPLKQVK